jgi:hypothetical protein
MIENTFPSGSWSSLICVLACSKILFMSLDTRLGIATTRCNAKNRQAYQNLQNLVLAVETGDAGESIEP